MTQCYSTGVVSGNSDVGGLVGYNQDGTVTRCYGTGVVDGNDEVGGLVGENGGDVTQCYSTGTVSGVTNVGGLVGASDLFTGRRVIANCYSTGTVSGTEAVGGLIGSNHPGTVIASFWDVETSQQSTSAAGTGKTTTEMQTGNTFFVWGACESVWTINEGADYPRLAWEGATGEIVAGPRYGGGTGTVQNPYLICTAEQLNTIGLAYCHWDKHFKLMADIDLSGFDGKDGRPAFNLIGSGERRCRIDSCGIVGIPFVGVFDGNRHTIANFTYIADASRACVGLFGYVADRNAAIENLRLVDPNVRATGGDVGCLVGALEDGTVTQCAVEDARVDGSVVGGLVGWNEGTVSQCYSTGAFSSSYEVGGLVGHNEGDVTDCHSTGTASGRDHNGGLVGYNYGSVSRCHSTITVIGESDVGGLVGYNDGDVTDCYSTGAVSGQDDVGGLVGCNSMGDVVQCYSTAAVSGSSYVGGLVGWNGYEDTGTVVRCYSIGAVSGTGQHVGGLVGYTDYWDPEASFWDTETSGLSTSASGTGKTTAEMQTAKTFLDAGWDFVGETANGTDDIWWILEGKDYPRLWWEKYSGGTGEPNDPFQIATAEDLMLLGQTPADYGKHFILTADIDLDPNLPGRKVFDRAVIAPDVNPTNEWWRIDGDPFTGVFDGNGHTISHLTIKGEDCLGVFGRLAFGAEVRNLGVIHATIVSSGDCVGGLVGYNSGCVTHCYSAVALRGNSAVGGLAGWNVGDVGVRRCYSTGVVRGGCGVGGLVGGNGGHVTQSHSNSAVTGTGWQIGGLVGSNEATLTQSFSTGTVSSSGVYVSVGGLVGDNGASAEICDCYSTSTVSGNGNGDVCVGGLVALNTGYVTYCYSTGKVSGGGSKGGLVAGEDRGAVNASFWDTQTSGQGASRGGTAKTTAEMQTARTFLDAGWDFVGETANGTEDIWWLLEGKDYPRLLVGDDSRELTL